MSQSRHDDPTSPPDATRGHPLAHVASAKVAERKTSGQPANGSFPAKTRRRGPREQSPTITEFVFQVRTPVPEHNPWKSACGATSRLNLATPTTRAIAASSGGKRVLEDSDELTESELRELEDYSRFIYTRPPTAAEREIEEIRQGANA